MRNLFAFDVCLDCGWKSSGHQGKHFPHVSFGCLFLIIIALLTPVLALFFRITDMIYMVLGVLLLAAIFFLIQSFIHHRHKQAPHVCPECGSNHIRHHQGLWD